MRLHDFVRRSATMAPAIVVSGDEVALSVVRDLGRERVPVLAMGPDKRSPTLRSRYCAPWPCANPEDDEEQLIADLETVGSLLPQPGVLFPAADQYCFAISRHKTRLEKSFIVPVMPWERMRLLADKELQLGLASEAGIDTPITAFIHGPDDLAAAADAVPFPAVLKPAVPKERFRDVQFKVVALESRRRLDEAYARFASYGPFLLQEIIPGGDDEVYIAGGDHDAQSRCVAMFTGRKLRQHPRGFGVSRLCETLWSTELAELTVRLLAHAGYQGVSDVEFKRDPRDGRFKLMEINARQGYWTALATASGVNLTYIAYRDATGRPCPECVQREGVRWTDILHEGPDSVRELWRGELGLHDWLAPLAGVRVDAHFSLRDPRPGLSAVGLMTGEHAKKAVLRLLGMPVDEPD